MAHFLHDKCLSKHSEQYHSCFHALNLSCNMGQYSNCEHVIMMIHTGHTPILFINPKHLTQAHKYLQYVIYLYCKDILGSYTYVGVVSAQAHSLFHHDKVL